jgi:putative ABC transport system substrate-binding protein
MDARERADAGERETRGSGLKRRNLLAFLAGAAITPVVWPRAARAQQPAMPVVGFLGSASPGLFAGRLRAFHQGLGDSGYVEGRNVAIEYRWAEGQNDRLPALAADLARRQVAVIFSNGLGAVAAKAATATIPIVFYTASEAVEARLVASLARPGGNLTGATSLNAELGPKRLEVLHELVPAATVMALLVNPTNPTNADTLSRQLQAAARTLGLELQVLHASTERDFNTVFATLLQLRAGALVIGSDALFSTRSEQLAALALRHAVPTIYQYREFTAAGGLASYGGSLTDAYRLAGMYTGRILEGEKPSDLPVQQTTKVELILNLRTAKALGLSVSLPLLGRADEVFE